MAITLRRGGTQSGSISSKAGMSSQAGKVGISGKAGMSGQAGKSGMTGKFGALQHSPALWWIEAYRSGTDTT
jgi:hypothetical protein